MEGSFELRQAWPLVTGAIKFVITITIAIVTIPVLRTLEIGILANAIITFIARRIAITSLATTIFASIAKTVVAITILDIHPRGTATSITHVDTESFTHVDTESFHIHHLFKTTMTSK